VELVAAAFLLTGLALWMLASQRMWLSFSAESSNDPRAAQAAFAQETGVWIVGVAVIAGGGMVDLRYQVVDPDKSVIVHDDEYPPGLLIESTGQVVNTPYHDHSAFESHQGVIYHEMIMNPGGVLKTGDEITVMIGQTRLEHVIVQ
jgi:hypothetical protein